MLTGHRFPDLAPPSSAHWFGTTSGQGQDVFSRVVYGARTALEVVVLAVAFSLLVGVPLGLWSGYRGGWVDRVLVLITDALFAFPSLLLAIVVSIALVGGNSGAGGGVLAAAISITVIYMPQYFRVVRNATISAKQEPYVEAARAIGASPFAHDVPVRLRQRGAVGADHRHGQCRRRHPDPGRSGLPGLRYRPVGRRRMGIPAGPSACRLRVGHVVDRSCSPGWRSS